MVIRMAMMHWWPQDLRDKQVKNGHGEKKSSLWMAIFSFK
jgi:hypothetical protein